MPSPTPCQQPHAPSAPPAQAAGGRSGALCFSLGAALLWSTVALTLLAVASVSWSAPATEAPPVRPGSPALLQVAASQGEAALDGAVDAGPEPDGEGIYPAGTASVAPFDSAEPASRTPLRHYTGKTIGLLTDTRNDYAGDLLQKLDSFISQAHAALGRVLDVQTSPKPTQIIVFESQERYQDYAREHAPGLVNNGGYYDGGMRTVVTYRFNNSMQLYFHELVHSMMGEQFSDHNFSRYTRHNWPIWFDEGMSEYLGSFDVQGSGIHIPAANKGKIAYLSNAIAHSVFVDLPTLLRAPAERFSGASMNIYYAESWGLLDYLLSSPIHKSRVPLFFRKIRQGDDGIAAFKACFGDDLQALDAAWRIHIQELAKPQAGWVSLFSGESIDDWTIHEGGQWRAGQGEIQGAGDRNYNYLIKSEMPMADFAYELDLQLQRGTAGLILGNNFHSEYPYYYLIDIARDAVMLRRAWSASQIEPVMQAYAEVPLGEWVHLRVQVLDHVLRLSVGGREVIRTRVDRDRYSLFGLYLYRARVRFRNIQVRREVPEHELATVQPWSTPAAGGPADPGPAPRTAPPSTSGSGASLGAGAGISAPRTP